MLSRIQYSTEKKGFFGNLMFSIIQHHLGPVSVAFSRDNCKQVTIMKKQIEEKGGEESEQAT